MSIEMIRSVMSAPQGAGVVVGWGVESGPGEGLGVGSVASRSGAF